ncbi:hypothetical protein Ddc_04728 [Ditylenchus destructor]|nr:hypothetical protein Ddc_04728 [Ditylenchus destructor]
MTLKNEPTEPAGEIFAIKQNDQFQEGQPNVWANESQYQSHSQQMRQNGTNSIPRGGDTWTDHTNSATQRSQMIPESRNSWENSNDSTYYPTQGDFNSAIACFNCGQQAPACFNHHSINAFGEDLATTQSLTPAQITHTSNESEIAHLRRMYRNYGELFCALQEDHSEINGFATADDERARDGA